MIYGKNLVAAACASFALAGAASAEKLDVASTFGTNNLLGQMGVKFAENVAIATGGDLELNINEPGDLVPTLEVFDSVASGAIDAGWDWMGYWSGTVPVAQFYGGLPFGPTSEVSSSWMWNGGGIEIIRREYAKHGVMVFPCFIEPQETAGWYREEITGPESYDGMKIRISGLGAKVLTKLGASTQLVPGGETFLAFDTNFDLCLVAMLQCDFARLRFDLQQVERLRDADELRVDRPASLATTAALLLAGHSPVMNNLAVFA